MSTTPSTPLLEVRDLVVEYPRPGQRHNPFRVLKSVSLDIRPGECVGLVGESGSGKTTLGRAVLGLAPVTGGQILFDGKDIAHADRGERRRLGSDVQVVLAPAPAHVAYGWHYVQRKETPKSEVSLQGVAVTLHRARRGDGTSAAAELTDAVIAQLQRAGLVVTVEEHDRLYSFSQTPYDGLVVMAGATDDPSRFMRKAGPAVTELYKHFENTLYDERRTQLEVELQRAWFEELSVVPLVVTSRLAAIRDDLKGPCWGAADSLWWNLDTWRFEATPAQSP